VIFDYAQNRVRDGVHPLTSFPVGAGSGFPASFAPSGPSTSLDSALRGKGPYAGIAYFFRGPDYMRLRTAPPAFDPPVSGSIGLWNLPSSFSTVDAAFNSALNREPYGYFFKDNKYVRYVWDQEAVDANYPKPISNLVGMPAAFAGGIDAAVDGAGPFAHMGYLFKDDRFLRFRWVASGEPHVEGTSVKIQGNWTGLAELLLAGKAKSQGLEWVRVARSRLSALSAGSLSPTQLAVVTAALATHFHITPVDAANLSVVSNMFTSIETTLRASARMFRFRTDDEARADLVPKIDAAYVGPWPPGPGTRINFTRNFKARSERNRASSVIHEAMHVNDPTTNTPSRHINEWYVSPALAPALRLKPVVDDDPSMATRYDLMPASDAIHNPASYATFARHVFFGHDNRENP
jgi:Hemopexin